MELLEDVMLDCGVFGRTMKFVDSARYDHV